MGRDAAKANQGTQSVALGSYAGCNAQGGNSVAVGPYAGQADQGDLSVAIGYAAGMNNQGDHAIAIGRDSARNNQGARSCIINSSGGNHQNTVADSLRIVQVRNVNGADNIRMYRHSSFEITYGTDSSDDRLKLNETLLTNATPTLLKLRPEKYDKLPALDEHSSNAVTEFGLIAQEVWYNTPELRCLVAPGVGANPTETVDIPDDPQQDPDYSSWGARPAGLTIEGLIPWLIKGVQEIHNELPRHRTKVPSVLYSNISNYTGMIVSKSPTITLSNVANDTSYFGIITDKPLDTTDSEILVQSAGEGSVWVTDVNGPLESGDFITTSNIAGYGMKQDDDLVHSYTVAKTTMPCDFNPQQVPVKRIIQQLSNVDYWVATVLSLTSESDYDEIIEEDRHMTITNIYDRNPVYTNENFPGPDIDEDTYNLLDSSMQSNFTLREHRNYYVKKRRVVTTNPNDDMYIHDVRQELVDVLDENGQQTWEETDETEPAYTLVDHGTHKAALVSCKLT
tara:strand:- start:579 stop:2105 length:1527 start_codon:yes stop_codon:yes gene_type:complete